MLDYIGDSPYLFLTHADAEKLARTAKDIEPSLDYRVASVGLSWVVEVRGKDGTLHGAIPNSVIKRSG